MLIATMNIFFRLSTNTTFIANAVAQLRSPFKKYSIVSILFDIFSYEEYCLLYLYLFFLYFVISGNIRVPHPLNWNTTDGTRKTVVPDPCVTMQNSST